jgi:hypothetical protein
MAYGDRDVCMFFFLVIWCIPPLLKQFLLFFASALFVA